MPGPVPGPVGAPTIVDSRAGRMPAEIPPWGRQIHPAPAVQTYPPLAPANAGPLRVAQVTPPGQPIPTPGWPPVANPVNAGPPAQPVGTSPPQMPWPPPGPVTENLPSPPGAAVFPKIVPEQIVETIVEEPIIEPPPRDWKGSMEVGANGSEGNSDLFNFRFGAHFKHETDDDILQADATYRNNKSEGEKTVDRLFLEGRQEWLFDQSPWNLFVHGTTEYDEFRPFDIRVTGDMGLGYQFIKNDITTLTGRFGSGVSHEIGGPDDSVVPEGVFGLDFERQISSRQRFTAKVDYFPDWTDYGDFRVNSQANWEFVISEENNMSLKFGLLDRYDSTPNGVSVNDLDYSATILWNF